MKAKTINFQQELAKKRKAKDKEKLRQMKTKTKESLRTLVLKLAEIWLKNEQNSFD